MKNEKFVELKADNKQFYKESMPSESAAYKCREELVKVINKFKVDVGLYAIGMIIQDYIYAYDKENVEWFLHVYKEQYDCMNYSMLTEEEYKSLWKNKKDTPTKSNTK